MSEYSTYFQTMKTDKNISSIIPYISDRLIVVKNGDNTGEIYFDYSPTERIKLSSGGGANSIYKCLNNYSEYPIIEDNVIQLPFNELHDLIDESSIIAEPLQGILVFDIDNNIGIITKVNKVLNSITGDIDITNSNIFLKVLINVKETITNTLGIKIYN